MTDQRLCRKCRILKPLVAFPKSVRCLGGRASTCHRCKHGKPPLTPQLPPEPAPVQIPDSSAFDIDVELDPLTVAYEKHAEAKQKRDLSREHKALLEENTALKDRIGELVQMQRPPDVIVYKQPSWERADAIACGVASDWHIEEPVIKEAVHGLNEYNLEIATQRSAAFFKNLLRLTDIMARDSKITTIHLSALGDFISGWIHEELIASGLLAPGDAARFWIGLFSSGIDFLLRESSYKLQMDMIPGNHGRMTKQVHFGDPTGTSLETFAYHALAARYEGNLRLEIRVSEHAMVYRPFFETFVMRLIHGYEVKYGGGVGGLTIPLNKAIAQWDIAKRASLTVLGHFHTFMDGGRFIANGSLIGYNAFGQAIKCTFEEPRQSFFLIHARNGGEKSVTAPIWVDAARS